ncbi:MAG: ribosome-associated translation inhibitor RaiA [Synergistaceae bacterium]|jgi:putative sigma-54 modulation protein|nr:ribosome-associated translation inhibitor RaiA [Synergistaceae bacterium]
MEVRFSARGTEIDAAQKSYMESKISKLEKFFGKILGTQIVVSFHKGNYNVETTANANGVIIRAEQNAREVRAAFDEALKNLERQIKRHSSYLKDKSQFSGSPDFTLGLTNSLADSLGSADSLESSDFEDSTAPVIAKVKQVPIHPMDPKEAVMQMELVGHSFFVFQNAESGRASVVYKRKNDTYGLLNT